MAVLAALDAGNELIDLASSPEAKRPAAPDRNDINYDRCAFGAWTVLDWTPTDANALCSDFENPYAPAPPDDADDYPQYLGERRGGYDSVEEISDNEVRFPGIVGSHRLFISPDNHFDNRRSRCRAAPQAFAQISRALIISSASKI